MFGPKIKISKELFERVKQASEKMGSSSVEEFVEKILEREVTQMLGDPRKNQVSQEEVDDIAEKLKGLGYIE